MRLRLPNKAILLFGLLAFFSSPFSSEAQRIIWAERNNNRIMEGVLSPSGVVNQTPFITGLVGPTQIALDISDERIFYTTQHGEDIYKASIYDGSGQQVVITTGAMVYFEDIIYSGSNAIFATMNSEVNGVYRIPDNNNDSGNETSLPLDGYDNSHHLGIAVSDSWGLMFLINRDDDILYSTNLGGTFADVFINSISNLEFLAIDDDNSIIYFTRVNPLNSSNEIYSCDFYGSNVTQLATVGAGQMKTIQVDTQRNKIVFLINELIREINTDGTGLTTIATLTGTGVNDFAIVPDYESPVFTSLTPLDNATGVNPSTAQINMVFNEPVYISGNSAAPGSDEIRIYENGNLSETISRSSSNISISGMNVAINLSVPLVQGNNYNVIVGAHVFSDYATNDFIGISLPTGWNFGTSCTLLSPTVIADQIICSGGDPALLSGGTPTGGNGTYTYQWESSTTSASAGFSPISGALNIDYDPPAGLAVTTYYRRIVNSGTCTPAVGSVFTVTVQSPPTIDTQPTDQQACAGSSAVFTVAATGTALTYQWRMDNGSVVSDLSDDGNFLGSNSNQLTILDVAGFHNMRFSCVVTSSATCSVPSAFARLTVTPFPVLVDQTPSVCESVAGSGTGTFDLTTLTTAITGGTNGVTLAWYLDDDYTTPVATPSSAVVSNGAVIYVEATLTAFGCTRRAKVTFTVNTLPTVTATPPSPETCSGSVITIALSANSSWTTASNPNITGATSGSGTSISVNLTNLSTTQQPMDYTITPSAAGCTGSPLTLTVLVNPAPTVFNVTGGGSYCQGTGGSVIGLDDSQAGVSYELLLNGANTGNIVAGNGSAINFSPVTATGNYTVRATGSGSCSGMMNGQISDVQMVTAPSGTGTITGSTSVCVGRTEQYQVSGIANAQTFEWEANDEILTATGATASLEVSGTSAIILTVVGINQCGRGGAAQLTLDMLAPPSVDIVLPSEVYAEEDAVFSYTTGTNDLNGSWDFGDGGSGSGQTTTYMYNAGGNYEVTVTVMENGCIGHDAETLTVRPKASLSDLNIKNAVTANGDLKNAFLFIEDLHKFPENEVILLDRWGVEVFRTRGYQNDWDLTKDGDYLPAGNYVCIVKLDETGETFKRAITVLRGR